MDIMLIHVPSEESEDEDCFCSFLMKNDIVWHTENSDYDLRLWRDVLKISVLEGNVVILDRILHIFDHCYGHIKCRQCNTPLEWISRNRLNSDEAIFICKRCSNAVPILQCNTNESTNILRNLLKIQNPQIIASSLKLLFLSGNFLNSISPPEIPDNPINVLKSTFDLSQNSLKLDGTIIADIYLPYKNYEFPILFLVDTVTIPPRHIFHVLKYQSEYYNSSLNKNKNDYNPNVTIPKYCEEYLIKELCKIANLYIKSGSFLVLGKLLQNFISSSYYTNDNNNKIKKHNLSYIVPLRNLCQYDCYTKHLYTITENFEKIVEPAINVCKIVQNVTSISIKNKSSEQIYNYLMLHFNVIVWLIHLHETPFETMIFHIIHTNKNKI